MAKLLNDWPSRWALAAPDKVAVHESHRGVSRTWRQLDQHAAALARFLAKEANVGVGDRVAFLGDNRLEHAEAFFAVARLRALLVPLNHKLAGPELARVVLDAEPKVIVTAGALAERARELVAALHAARPNTRAPIVVALDGVREIGAPGELALFGYEQILAGPRDGVPAEAVVDETDPWLVLYTSGSTGRPKGALVTHRQIVWNALQTTIACELGRERHDAHLHAALLHGRLERPLDTALVPRCASQLAPRVRRRRDRSPSWQSEKISVIFGVPTTLAAMREHADFRRDRPLARSASSSPAARRARPR